MPYAAATSVSIGKTREEIERALSRAGATDFGYMVSNGTAILAFQIKGKMVRFHLPLPVVKSYELSPAKRRRTAVAQLEAQAQDHKARWRALGLGIKAKLIFVESGIRTFEQEFLSDFVMPNGKTLGECAIPQLEDYTKLGKMPQLSLM